MGSWELVMLCEGRLAPPSLSLSVPFLGLASPMFADPFVDEGNDGLVQQLGQRGAGPGDMIQGYL